MRRLALLAWIAAAMAPGPVEAADRPDRVVADFEGDDYAPWVADGPAFGRAPARGAWPGQMAVSGYRGRGLANSFEGGDDSVGTLTSSPFRVDRPWINFLIGGGKFPGETCLDLLVDGRVVRTATGPNDRPGGSEQLDWASWDVLDLAGREATLRVVDRRAGGWGHVSVDQITLADGPMGLVPRSRDLVADRRYLHLPVRNDAPSRRVRVVVAGATAREFDIKLADAAPDFFAFLDLEAYRGRPIRVESSLPASSAAFDRLILADAVPDAAGLYREALRPRFHFTSRRGWLNDPNGLVFHDGVYHLYYQHNPYGWDWGNMHWGHATSSDLVRWTELPIALYPREYGDWAFSGSAVVDVANTSGFGSGGKPPLVAAFTSTGRGECIAFSNDEGRTWSEFAGNPVVRHEGRDPKLIWHAPTRRWVMAVYDEAGGRRSIVFHTSPDLKGWTAAGRVEGFYECPDLFELPVEGTPGQARWVLSAADGAYLLGAFDGLEFRPDSPAKLQLWRGDYYAAQTYSDAPGGRRIQVGWARDIAMPGMPFNQQMTLPHDLTLRATPGGLRLAARPVAGLATLRTASKTWADPDPALDPLGAHEGDLFEVRVEARVGAEGGFTLTSFGTPIRYDARARTLQVRGVAAPLEPIDGLVKLHVFIDRTSIEVFANDGLVAISRAAPRVAGSRPLSLRSEGARFPAIEVHDLASAWR